MLRAIFDTLTGLLLAAFMILLFAVARVLFPKDLADAWLEGQE